MECKTWSQSDAQHWRGLCSNEFYPEDDAASCQVCVTPVTMTDSCSDCLVVPSAFSFVLQGVSLQELEEADPESPPGTSFEYFLTEEEVINFPVNRINKCEWTATRVFARVRSYNPTHSPDGSGFFWAYYKIKKDLGIGGGSTTQRRIDLYSSVTLSAHANSPEGMIVNSLTPGAAWLSVWQGWSVSPFVRPLTHAATHRCYPSGSVGMYSILGSGWKGLLNFVSMSHTTAPIEE